MKLKWSDKLSFICKIGQDSVLHDLKRHGRQKKKTLRVASDSGAVRLRQSTSATPPYRRRRLWLFFFFQSKGSLCGSTWEAFPFVTRLLVFEKSSQTAAERQRAFPPFRIFPPLKWGGKNRENCWWHLWKFHFKKKIKVDHYATSRIGVLSHFDAE